MNKTTSDSDMIRTQKPGTGSAADMRKKRLVKQLRQNLRRRKAQSRLPAI